MKAQNTNPFRFSCGHCHQLVGSVHVILQILTGTRHKVRHFCSRACVGSWLANAP